MFHIHTSLVETTEEVSRLSKANENLEIEKQDLELQLVELETLVGQYHGKNKPCSNIPIGLDYDTLNNNRKVEGDKGIATVSDDVPAMLRKDNEKKCTEITPTSKAEKKPMVDQTPKKPIKEIKTENAGKEEEKHKWEDWDKQKQ
ncbi:hypothetical protein AgCh_040236 [Apium graveolens]